MIGETGLSAWLLAKIAPTMAALFGGLSLVLFWTPAKLVQKGKIVSIFLAGALAATFGFAFTGAVAIWLGVQPTQLDYIVGLAWCLGFVSTAVFNWVANFISKRAEHDVLDVYVEVTNKLPGRKPAAITPAAAKPTTKPAAKKPAAKRTVK